MGPFSPQPLLYSPHFNYFLVQSNIIGVMLYMLLLYTYAVICPNNIVSALCNNIYFGWRRID